MSQQKVFIKGLLKGSKQKETIKVNIKATKYGVPYVIEVKPQDNGILPYRVLNEKGDSIWTWDTWESDEEIDETFKKFSWD